MEQADRVSETQGAMGEAVAFALLEAPPGLSTSLGFAICTAMEPYVGHFEFLLSLNSKIFTESANLSPTQGQSRPSARVM